MALRINNLEEWQQLDLDKGAVVNLPADNRRTVRVHVNTTCETAFHLHNVATGQLWLLGLVKGLDVVEFVAEGPSYLVATPSLEGGEVWFFTAENQPTATYHPEAVIFTEPLVRRPRNPDLELMQALMRQNNERLMRQQEDFKLWWEEKERANAGGTGAHVDSAANPASASGSAAKPSGDGTPPPSGADGGGNGGTPAASGADGLPAGAGGDKAPPPPEKPKASGPAVAGKPNGGAS